MAATAGIRHLKVRNESAAGLRAHRLAHLNRLICPICRRGLQAGWLRWEDLPRENAAAGAL